MFAWEKVSEIHFDIFTVFFGSDGSRDHLFVLVSRTRPLKEHFCHRKMCFKIIKRMMVANKIDRYGVNDFFPFSF